MNKTAIKNYAVAARRELITAVCQKAFQYGVHADKTLPVQEVQGGFIYNGVTYTKKESEQRKRLIDTINSRDGNYADAYKQVMEEVAYTWFNRLIALRFMEVNDYLPSGVRILSSVNSDRLEPDCIRESARLDFVDQSAVAEFGTDEQRYRYILISQCNALADIMPRMFEMISDYTELLLPDRLYTKDGIVYNLVHGITEADFGEQVEIIGWLYQYYISEKKDEVFAGLKKNIKITKENIPAATQLFTPDWIVKYMVENSLGRLWLEHDKAQSKLSDEYVNASYYGWKYYLEEAQQEPDVQKQLDTIREEYKGMKPEDIKLIDPCMGSGHILVYAFDVLYQIYQSQGYAERDIPNMILENNIYGLDLDARAGQLAYFALMMKARSYNRRFFRQTIIPQPMVYSMSDKNTAKTVSRHPVMISTMQLLHEYFDVTEYGSIIKNHDYINFDEIYDNIINFQPDEFTFDTVGFEIDKQTILALCKIGKVLFQKYDVVVTNPPYMGGSGMGARLSEYVKENYPDSKSDLSTVFMEKTLDICKPAGYMAMINIPVWMFLSSYEKLRERLLRNSTFINLLHMGRGVFGADFGTTTFVIKANSQPNYVGLYRKLYSRQGAVDSMEKKLEFFFSDYGKYEICQDDFSSVPSSTIAYSASKTLLDAFRSGKRIDSFADPKQGLATADNSRFLRLWHEVSYAKCGFSLSQENAKESKSKWFPYNKGGGFKKWYGNNEYVINWETDGFELRNFSGSVIRSPQFYFMDCLSWCKVTISGFSMRYIPTGFIFDVAGCSLFNTKEKMKYVLAFANSKVNAHILAIISPTVNYEVGHVASLPIVGETNENIEELVAENIAICRTDWDSFETSWDFKVHPLIAARGNYEEAQPLEIADDLVEGVVVTEWSKISTPIAQAFDAWERFTDAQFQTLKYNEEELNRIFIDLYGLQNELTPEVDDKDVTIRRADLGREIRSLISYAVGCMFGRYSLDEEGLIYAGGAWAANRYNTFIPEDDNILPITDADYFEDDIVVRFVEFIKTVYGAETLAENLDFIAGVLYPNAGGSSREKIRRYFLNDFYKDHCKIYQKKPIYWMFDSGKEAGFKALVYLHRYDKYTAARVRTDYLHPLQRKYEAEIGRLQMLTDLPGTKPNEAAAYKKQIESIRKKAAECVAYDQAIAHIAHQAIELDLDDGVTANYAKFQNIEVPQGDGRGSLTMNLLAKI